MRHKSSSRSKCFVICGVKGSQGLNEAAIPSLMENIECDHTKTLSSVSTICERKWSSLSGQ